MKIAKKLIAILLGAAMILSLSVTAIGYTYTINDALNILKHLAELEMLTDEQKEIYDLDETPGIAIGDALEILKHLARLPNLIDNTTAVPGNPVTGTCFACAKTSVVICPSCRWCVECDVSINYCAVCSLGEDCCYCDGCKQCGAHGDICEGCGWCADCDRYQRCTGCGRGVDCCIC
jgi:hypothetical protein